MNISLNGKKIELKYRNNDSIGISFTYGEAILRDPPNDTDYEILDIDGKPTGLFTEDNYANNIIVKADIDNDDAIEIRIMF